MKQTILVMVFLILLGTVIFCQEQKNENNSVNVPLTMVFHNFGWNVLNSFACNFGLNFLGAGAGTLAFIKTGLDWKWNRLAYNNDWMPSIGWYANVTGYAVPVLAPVSLYLTGIFSKNPKLQIAGLAVLQSHLITLMIQTPIKMITGRTWPGIVDGWDSPLSKRSGRTDDYSGAFNWFNLDAGGGWPSGHTANAFAAAAALAQIYNENTLLKIAVFSYASLVGIGMSVYDHWASDVLGGALIGLAAGTAVGKSFRCMTAENKFMIIASGRYVGLLIKI